MSIYSEKIYPLIEKIIRNHNYELGRNLYELSFNDLEIDEQQQLAKMMIVHYGHDLDSIYDNNDHDLIRSSLINILHNPDVDNKICFAELVMEKVIEYYQPKIQEMIDDIIGWVEQEDMEESGFERHYHKDNGEYFWIKG